MDHHPLPPQRLHGLPTWLVNHLTTYATRTVVGAVGSREMRTAYTLLATLEEDGAMSQADLGRRLGIDRKDMSGALDAIEAEGFVQRRPDPDDRRRNAIHVTAKGSRRLAELETSIQQAQRDFTAPLDDAERQQLVALLQRLVAHHRAS